MKTQLTMEEFGNEIKRREANKTDLLVPKQKMSVVLNADQKLVLRIQNGVNRIAPINFLAHQQIATDLQIPFAYYQRMEQQHPSLLATTVNVWLQDNPTERKFVRVLDGSIRAILSERYNPLDNYDLMVQGVFPVLKDAGIKTFDFKSMALTDKRLYLKIISKEITGEIKKGDMLRGGIVISNSETGQGTLEVKPFIERLACTNGMVVTEYAQRRRHVGKRHVETEDLSIYSNETLNLDRQAFFSKVRDTVKLTLNQARFDFLLDKFRDASSVELKKPLEVLEVTQRSFGWSEDEKNLVHNHFMASGDNSLWGMANAITRTAEDLENYDRATEFEEFGYKILNVPKKDYAIN